LSLKPPSEGRYDYIALVPLDFRRPERHARKSTPKLSRRSASRTSTSRPSHDLDGALAFVRGSHDASADLASLSDREAARMV
jgi:hypothetical protein